MATAALASFSGTSAAQVVIAWPQGTAFPLMMYEVQVSDAPNLVPYGWNVLQYYNLEAGTDTGDYLAGLLANGAAGMAQLPVTGTTHPFVSWPDPQMQSWVQDISTNLNLSWWSLPEEMSPLLSSELEILADYTTWTRQYDPLQRPTYEYTENGLRADTISQIVSNVDVVGLGCYCEYIGMPHAWVRYVVQEVGLKGISMAGATVGGNYLAGQKTPVAVLFCAKSADGNTNPPVMPLPMQTYHDFWSAVASGAKGVSVFAYGRALTDDPRLVANLQQLNLAAAELTSSENIASAVLYGAPNTNVTFSILSGPAQTVSFQPPGTSISFQYPSLNVLCETWSDVVFVIAVNSTDQPVTAVISNLPSAAASATLPFEARTVALGEGSFTDCFAPWDVHIYKMDGSIQIGGFTPSAGGSITFQVANSGVLNYTVLSSTDLTSWTPIAQAVALAPGLYQCVDTNQANSSLCFYRLRWP